MHGPGFFRVELSERQPPRKFGLLHISSWVPASTYPLSMSLKVAKSRPSQDGPRLDCEGVRHPDRRIVTGSQEAIVNSRPVSISHRTRCYF